MNIHCQGVFSLPCLKRERLRITSGLLYFSKIPSSIFRFRTCTIMFSNIFILVHIWLRNNYRKQYSYHCCLFILEDLSFVVIHTCMDVREQFPLYYYIFGYLLGPISSILVNKYGSRIVMIIGGCLSGCGLIAASFCNTVQELYFCIGFVGGELLLIHLEALVFCWLFCIYLHSSFRSLKWNYFLIEMTWLSFWRITDKSTRKANF